MGGASHAQHMAQHASCNAARISQHAIHAHARSIQVHARSCMAREPERALTGRPHLHRHTKHALDEQREEGRDVAEDDDGAERVVLHCNH